MSTKFYAASHTTIPQTVVTETVKLHDTDSPETFFRTLNQVDPLVNGNWTVNILDYKGDTIQENIDWKNVTLRLTEGNVLTFTTVGDLLVF